MRPLRVVADIGGTSARWAWGPGHDASSWQVHEGDLPGFNPLQGDGQAFGDALRTGLLTAHPRLMTAQHVVVYGAGCGDEVRAARMRAVVEVLFPKAVVEVDTDLLGAARSLYGREAGLVLILGTGMNAGHFTHGALFRSMPSLGYLLGDEGSGADIGRHLLRELLYGQVPGDLSIKLYGERTPEVGDVLARVHQASSPARELAAETRRLSDCREHPWVHDLLLSRFAALAGRLRHAFPPDERQELRAVGSVAHAFQPELAQALAGVGIRLTAVERDPMPGLVRHHCAQP